MNKNKPQERNDELNWVTLPEGTILIKVDMKAEFIWGLDADTGVLIILDLDRGSRSVTNDAENVLTTIREHMGADAFDALSAIIYRDSMRMFDGLLFSPGNPARADFYGIQKEGLTEAIARALELEKGSLIK